MPLPYPSHIPETVGELVDHLSSMMLGSPDFKDRTGYFPNMSIDTEFFVLNKSLERLRGKLGDERYEKLVDLSCRMRAHFEADPENKTDDTIAGRRIIDEMQQLLKKRT